MSEPYVDVQCGDVREVLAGLPEESVQCVITSPPYWGLRDYGVDGQLGSEKTPEEYVDHMVAVFDDVKRVLRPDGCLWLNIGDTYIGGGRGGGSPDCKQRTNVGSLVTRTPVPDGYKRTDLVGIPWLLAFALRAAGWYLRCDVIWFKPNPMPESVTTRPTRAHEYLFLLSKSEKYFYDIEATKEPYAESTKREAAVAYHGQETKDYDSAKAQQPSASKRRIVESIKRGSGRQKRDVWGDEGAVWTIPVQPYRGGHFATFPERLVEPCVLAATSAGGQCAACGTPYRRVVEREPIPDEIRAKFEAARQRTAADTGRTDGHTNYKPNFKREVKTIGWTPGCDCDDGTDAWVDGSMSVPQIVLDPFVGSGRAGMVARRLGRSFVGIDLNPDYVMQALANIYGVSAGAEVA